MAAASAIRPPADPGNPTLRTLLESHPAQLLPELECVTVGTGEVVFDNAAPDAYALFPSSCVLSLRSLMPEGSSAEVALVGGDGIVGLGGLAGRRPPGGKLHLQWRSMRAGTAWRLPMQVLMDLADASPTARKAISEWQVRLAWEFLVRGQCNRHHRIEQQLCGWLLRYRALAGIDEVACTQQEIADVIGVRREGITEVLGRLEQAGAVDCGRGRLRITGPAILAARSCDCQRTVDARLSATIDRPVATNTADRPAALSSVAP